MSWQPKILNREDEKIQRTVRVEDEVDADELAKTTPNVVKISNDKFICPPCGEGWTFARMKTIVCCGITYVKK